MSAPALTPGQQAYRDTLSKLTGLDPRVVSVWLYAEENGAAAATREQQGNHNWLNIGPGRTYTTPQQGAAAAAHLLNTSGYYSAIRAAARARNPSQQLTAITHSPWDAGHYGGGQTLHNLYRQFGGQAQASPAPAPASSSSSSGLFSADQQHGLVYALVFVGAIVTGVTIAGLGLNHALGGAPARAAGKAAKRAGKTAAVAAVA